MTFRTRLVLAATAAVLVVVVLGSFATYIVAYNSLVGSVDVTLSAEAHDAVASPDAPDHAQLRVGPHGDLLPGGDLGRLRIIDPDQAPGPAHRPHGEDDGGQPGTAAGHLLLDHGQAASTCARSWSPSPRVSSEPGEQQRRSASAARGGALQITAPLTGVNHELRHLALALWLIVLVGVTVAVLLGLAVGRTVLRPLNSLTSTVEELAETTDVSKRLDPGGPDELGRLRRAFNRLLVALDTSRESQRQLVLDASHELRTPLTSLRTNMEVARRLEELAPEEREVLISDVHHPAGRADRPGGRLGRAGPGRAAPS